MDKKTVAELTEDFFRASVVVDAPVDTSSAIIPAPQSTDEIIRRTISFHASTMTAQLRCELRGEIANVERELAAMQREREAMAIQRRILGRECAEVRYARERLDCELNNAQADRRAMAVLYNRVCAASGLCTPSRNNITGR